MIWFALRDRRTSLVEDSMLKDSASRRQTFTAAMAQFEEQMEAAKVVTPATRPLNLYYGLAQAGMAIAAAHAPKPWSFVRHGLKLVDTKPNLTEIEVTPEGDGAFQRVASATGSPVIEGPVPLRKLWASLPDLNDVELPGSTEPIPIPLSVDDFYTTAPRAQLYVTPPDMPEGVTEQAQRLLEFLSAYPDAKDLAIPATHSPITPPAEPGYQWEVTVEWPPLDLTGITTDKDIDSFFDEIAPKYRYRNDRFLRPPVEDGKRSPSFLMAWWLLLYSFSILARYQPRKWTALLDLNRSASAVALQYALEVAISAIPHLVLEALDGRPWLMGKPVSL